MVAQDGINSVSGLQLGKRLHEREYLIGIMVYQVPSEDGQIRLLRIAQSYGLFQCSGIVAPTARMHVGQLQDPVSVEFGGEVAGGKCNLSDLEKFFSFDGSEQHISHGGKCNE